MTNLVITLIGAGVVIVIGAALLAWSHNHHPAPKPADVVPPAPPAPVAATAPTVPVPQIDTAALEQATQAAFTQAVNDSAEGFKQDIHGASERLGQLIVKLTSEVVERELETYRAELSKAREASLQSLHSMQATIEQKQTELETDLDGELAKRKQVLLERLDTKLGVAVTTFIVERLGQGVDLGAQRPYLIASLERHKDELKQDLGGGH